MLLPLIMITEKTFKSAKMLKFAQFCNFYRAPGKINAFKNCSSGIWAGDFLSVFLKF